MHDLELIDRIKKKDETSLIDLIYRASYKILNNKELSEECLNLVLMKIWEGIEFYNKDEGLFKNWIYTLSKYTAIDIMRKEIKYIKNTLELKDNKEVNRHET